MSISKSKLIWKLKNRMNYAMEIAEAAKKEGDTILVAVSMNSTLAYSLLISELEDGDYDE